jgi:hypothetical protein
MAPAEALDRLKQAACSDTRNTFFLPNFRHAGCSVGDKRSSAPSSSECIPMKTLISSAAYAASVALSQQGLAVKRSHLAEVIAALLGYRTFAALSVEEEDMSLTYHLEDAELYVLNIPRAEERALSLKQPNTVAACVLAMKAEFPVPVYDSVDDFWDSHTRELVEDAIEGSDEVSGAMGDSNATFPYSPDLDEPETSGDLWASSDSWTIEAQGTMTGEYDPEGDRMYTGHKLDVWGERSYYKAGRAGLVFDDGKEGASPDDTWREDDSVDDLDEAFEERMTRED